MRYFKPLLFYIAADVMSLFIGLTLAVSPSMVFRAVSAVCTAGIMLVIMGDLAYKTAREDIKNGDHSPLSGALMSISASSVSIVSWIILVISVKTGSFDFYRFYKLINGGFLQLCNFIESDASSKALSAGETALMLPLAFIPGIAFAAVYIAAGSRTRAEK